MDTLLNPIRYVIYQYKLDAKDSEPVFVSLGRLKGIYLDKEQAEKVCEIKQKDSNLFLQVHVYLGDL